MLTDIDGVRVGHWTNPAGDTGCTVVLLPSATVASGEVRGGAPATREFALLDPSRMMQQVNAVVLSGGSAFGLACGDGVMNHLAEHEVGFATAGGVVPIVVGMSIYDLTVATGPRPGAAEGRAAAEAAADGPVETGLVGGGAGATCRKWWGADARRPGGVGMATVREGELMVSAMIVVNALGDIDPGDGSMTAMPPPPPEPTTGDFDHPAGTNTTIGLIVTNARLTKMDCHLLAQGGHDGLARALVPAHTAADGDALVAAATGEVDADPTRTRILATEAVTQAIRSLH